MAITLREQTLAQFAARFWAKVRAAQLAQDQPTLHRLVWWILERIAAGDVTDAQVLSSFNSAFGRSLNLTQWTAFKTTTLQPIHDRYANMQGQAAL